MIDLDLDKDVTVQAAGKTWTVGRLRVGMIEGFAGWARPRVQSQLDFLRESIQSVPPEARAAKVDEALDLLKQIDNFSLESPLAKALFKTSAGLIELIRLRLLPGHPDATAEDAWDVLQAVGASAPKPAKAKDKQKASATEQ